MATKYKGSKEEKTSLNAFISLMRAADSISSRMHRGFADHELTESQFAVLEVLVHLGPLCQKDIAEKILKSGGNITMVVDNLTKQGLVERVPDTEDRRRVSVQLTRARKKKIESIFRL